MFLLIRLCVTARGHATRLSCRVRQELTAAACTAGLCVGGQHQVKWCEIGRQKVMKTSTVENQLPKLHVSRAEDLSRGQGPLQKVRIFSDPLPRGRVGQLVRIWHSSVRPTYLNNWNQSSFNQPAPVGLNLTISERRDFYTFSGRPLARESRGKHGRKKAWWEHRHVGRQPQHTLTCVASFNFLSFFFFPLS